MKTVSHQRETLGKTHSSMLLSLLVPVVAVGGGGVSVLTVSSSSIILHVEYVFGDISDIICVHVST